MNAFTVHVKPLIADVPGWLTDEEGEALYNLARACTGEGVIVEIGSWMGKSTICLGRGSLAGSSVPIYAIDPHADHRFGDFKANVDRAGITDLVTPIASLSQPAADDFHEPISTITPFPVHARARSKSASPSSSVSQPGTSAMSGLTCTVKSFI